jgi:hypothetical protein
MSKNPAPRVQFNFLEDEIDDEPEINESIVDIEDDETGEPPLSLPEPVERETIEHENIFDVPETPNQLLKELVDKKLPKPKKEPKKQEPKLTKTGKVRKPMTEHQKEKLALGRQRALESRRRKKAEKDEAKAQEKQEAELLKKKRQMDLEKLKKEVEEPQTPKPAPAPVQPQGMFLTPKQLEEAQLSAIMSYEKIRAERKKKKMEEQLIEQQKQEIRDKLTRPAGYGGHYTEKNRFYGYY